MNTGNITRLTLTVSVKTEGHAGQQPRFSLFETTIVYIHNGNSCWLPRIVALYQKTSLNLISQDWQHFAVLLVKACPKNAALHSSSKIEVMWGCQSGIQIHISLKSTETRYTVNLISYLIKKRRNKTLFERLTSSLIAVFYVCSNVEMMFVTLLIFFS